MLSLKLFLGGRPACSKVRDLTGLPEGVDCVSLSACASLCLSRWDAGKITRDSGDFVLLGDDKGGLVLGRNGVVCWAHQSADVVDSGVGDDDAFECLVSNMEGVLDDGLALGKDFLLIDAFPYRELAGLDRAFLASANANRDGFWCFVLRMQKHAALKLLQSSTMGYLMGVRITNVENGSIVRLIRCAGYDDSDTDLMISDGQMWEAKDVLATF